MFGPSRFPASISPVRLSAGRTETFLSGGAALILTQQGKNAADLTGCLEKQTNLFGDVGIHVIVGGPFGLSGVHVEAGPRAEVV